MDLLDVVTQPPPIRPKLVKEQTVDVLIEGEWKKGTTKGNKDEIDRLDREFGRRADHPSRAGLHYRPRSALEPG